MARRMEMVYYLDGQYDHTGSRAGIIRLQWWHQKSGGGIRSEHGAVDSGYIAVCRWLCVRASVSRVSSIACKADIQLLGTPQRGLWSPKHLHRLLLLPYHLAHGCRALQLGRPDPGLPIPRRLLWLVTAVQRWRCHFGCPRCQPTWSGYGLVRGCSIFG